MADLSASYAYTNVLQAVTREAVLGDIVYDQLFQGNKFFMYLLQRDMVRYVKGGTAITWVNNFGRSPNSIAFDGADNLPVNSLNGNLVRASLPWRGYADALVLNVTDLVDNEGSDEAILGMVEAQLDITRMSMLDLMSQDVVTNTNSISPRGFDGLAEAIDNGPVAPTYANIARATYGTKWSAQVNYNVSGTVAANLLPTIHQIDINASIDNSRPDAYFCNRLILAQLIEGLFTQDAYIQPDMARTAGGNDYIFNGNPLFVDNHFETNTSSPTTSALGGFIRGLNSSFIKLVINPKLNFHETDWIAAQSNATMFTRLLFRGNLVVPKPQAHWALFWVSG
jgi:hypothetical protein